MGFDLEINSMWGMVYVLLASAIGAESPYQFPDAYEHGDCTGAVVDEVALATLIKENSTDGDGEEGLATVARTIDLNNDGNAEIFLLPSRVESTHPDWFRIYEKRDGRYVEIGDCTYWFSLCRSKNGYARILNRVNSGLRTDPIWTVVIAAHNETRYDVEHRSTLTAGQMTDRGIEAYRSKDYPAAEIWFLNVLRAGLGIRLHAENNLALVHLQTSRYQEVIDRLNLALAERNIPVDNEWANAHYNLGKAFEALNDFPAAWKHYHAACNAKPTPERKATLRRLVKNGIDTSGFEVIW